MGRRAQGFDRELRELGGEVARRRGLLELTQPALAERANLSLDGLLRIEKGKSAPTAVTLIQLGRALGCTAAALLETVETGPQRVSGKARETDLSGIEDLLREQPPHVVEAAETCVRAVVSAALRSKQR